MWTNIYSQFYRYLYCFISVNLILSIYRLLIASKRLIGFIKIIIIFLINNLFINILMLISLFVIILPFKICDIFCYFENIPMHCIYFEMVGIVITLIFYSYFNISLIKIIISIPGFSISVTFVLSLFVDLILNQIYN